MRNQPFLVLTAGVAAVAACSQGPDDDAGHLGAGIPTTQQVGAGDLPCDLAEALSVACWGCHSGPNTLGATSLDSYDALVAPAASDPALTVAQVALERMQDPASPMPPGGGVDPASLGLLEAWIADGYPKGECGTEGTPSQGETPVVCTSGTFWTNEDDEGSKDMNPGEACIACHKAEDEGPALLFAGTVYPSLHEPDDCNGTPGAVVVVVVDADNHRYETEVRMTSGNFFIETDEDKPIVLPVTAEVWRGDKVIQMVDPVNSADCNSCHTVEGASGAAGRIVAP